ncbi:hypothetical protein [Lysinibacter cavernae]|uniref:Uncharacterized protein n=1 Tax=Lysinibacter cavernae TaxID=1640652 RepID=A0A7X5QZH9_9MICO|nr:hypothetical protein [Lysinibacter cavernae]NIH52889.1 hypothetical protein [Lysinibacter cavernae]
MPMYTAMLRSIETREIQIEADDLPGANEQLKTQVPEGFQVQWVRKDG